MADREGRWEELRRLKRKGDWRAALSLIAELHDPLLLWLRPTLDVLHFLGEELRSRGVSAVLSIGCGSGLLEWILAGATGLRVTGVEVNREWWECKYSPPTFLPLVYQDDTADPAGNDINNNPTGVAPLLEDTRTALLFCYFNDTAAFLEYVTRFRGHCVVVAGPGPGAPAHCQPQPFSHSIPAAWSLARSARVGTTKDWVAIYTRVESNSQDNSVTTA